MACDRRKVIDAMFVSGVVPQSWRRDREHLFACEACRAYYDRVMLLSRKLDGDRAGLSRAQLSFVGGLVLDSAVPRRRALDWAALRPLLPYVAGVGLALALVFSVPPLVERVDGGFTARGEASELSGAGIKVACVGEDAQGRPFLRGAMASSSTSELTCKRADTMHVTYSNAVREPFAWVFVFGLDERGGVHWNYPQPEAARSFAAERRALDAALPGGVELSAGHDTGRLRVTALFTREPLALHEVRAQVAGQGGISGAAVASVGVLLED